MKKSVKSFLLAVMALCLCATAGFAASYDVSFDVVLGNGGTGLAVSPDNGIKVKSDEVHTRTADSMDAWTPASGPDAGVYGTTLTFKISYDVTVFTGETKPQFKFNVKPTTTGVKLYRVVKSGDNTVYADTDSQSKSLDVPANGSADNYLLVVSGDDSGDLGVKVVVYGLASGSKAAEFGTKTVTITAGASADKTTLTIAAASVDNSAKPFELTVDTGATVSFDASACSTDLVPASISTTPTTVGFTPKDFVYVVTAPTTAGASFDFTLAFKSSDANKIASYVVRVIASGDADSNPDDKTGTTVDAGTITFTNEAGTAKTVDASKLDSGDIFKEAELSSDVVVDTAEFEGTAETDTITVSYDATKVTEVEVYSDAELSESVDLTDNAVSVSDGDELYFVFTTSADLNDADKFIVKVTYTYSGSSEGDTDTEPPTPTPDELAELEDPASAVADFTAAESSTVTGFDDLTTGEVETLETGYADLLSELGVSTLKDLLATKGDSGYPRFAVMKLGRAATTTDTIIVRFLTATGVGVAPTSSSTVTIGTFVPKAESDVIIIDCQGLTDPKATGSDKALYFDPGIYAILARIYTKSTESLTVTATDDSETSLPAAEYDGNTAPTTDDDADTDHTSSKGSSSGCDAGFGALALIALALPLVRKIKK